MKVLVSTTIVNVSRLTPEELERIPVWRDAEFGWTFYAFDSEAAVSQLMIDTGDDEVELRPWAGFCREGEIPVGAELVTISAGQFSPGNNDFALVLGEDIRGVSIGGKVYMLTKPASQEYFDATGYDEMPSIIDFKGWSWGKGNYVLDNGGAK